MDEQKNEESADEDASVNAPEAPQGEETTEDEVDTDSEEETSPKVE